MMKEIYYCDVCHKRIKKYHRSFPISVVYISKGNFELELVKMDLCEVCLNEIYKGKSIYKKLKKQKPKYFFKKED